MLFYNNKKLKEQIEADFQELETYKNSYNNMIVLYNEGINDVSKFENKISRKDIKNKIQIFQTQIKKIDTNLNLLANLKKEIDINENIMLEKKKIKKYNQKYKEIRNNYIINSSFKEYVTENYIDGLMEDLVKKFEKMQEDSVKIIEQILTKELRNCSDEVKKKEIIQDNNKIEENKTNDIQLKNNNTLLISEKSGKVVLPYRAEDVLSILKNENNIYNTTDDVIKDKFTRDFSDYRIQFASRYIETMKLAREREKYNFIDSIVISIEMMKKRFLHPAIISACRSLNELDVYLDCLDKNELEDFKIFKIKYELYPVAIKQQHNKNKVGLIY